MVDSSRYLRRRRTITLGMGRQCLESSGTLVDQVHAELYVTVYTWSVKKRNPRIYMLRYGNWILDIGSIKYIYLCVIAGERLVKARMNQARVLFQELGVSVPSSVFHVLFITRSLHACPHEP